MSITAVVLFSAIVLVQQSPHRAPERTAESVRIDAPSGAVLAGEFVNAGPGAPAIILFHMCRADAVDGWQPVADRLNAADITTLRVSPPGLGGGTPSPKERPAWGPDAGAALAYLRSRSGAEVPVAVAGASCSVSLALGSAVAHPQRVRAAVLLSGSHTEEQLEFVRMTPHLAVFSGASEGEQPSPDWARGLKDASAHPASRVRIFEGRLHGTDMFQVDPGFAREVANWLVQQLKGRQPAGSR